VEGQLEDVSKHQIVLSQANSLLTDQLESEISSLRASLSAVTREHEDTRNMMYFVSSVAVLNVVFMGLLFCYRPGAALQLKRIKLGRQVGEMEETPREVQDCSSKSDPSRLTFSKAAGERSKRRKHTRT